VSGSTTEITVALIAAAGAFLVAFIAGGFSLLGLIISKEQQVSAFRQAWIDALRADLASLVARAYQIQSFVVMHEGFTQAELWKATRDDYVDLNQASTRIKLRLNPDEDESKKVLKSMSKMEGLFRHMTHPQSSSQIDDIVTEIERDAPPLLKKEWNRVKKGERIYRFAKFLAGLIFVVAGIVAGVLLWKLWSIKGGAAAGGDHNPFF